MEVASINLKCRLLEGTLSNQFAFSEAKLKYQLMRQMKLIVEWANHAADGIQLAIAEGYDLSRGQQKNSNKYIVGRMK